MPDTGIDPLTPRPLHAAFYVLAARLEVFGLSDVEVERVDLHPWSTRVHIALHDPERLRALAKAHGGTIERVGRGRLARLHIILEAASFSAPAVQR